MESWRNRQNFFSTSSQSKEIRELKKEKQNDSTCCIQLSQLQGQHCPYSTNITFNIAEYSQDAFMAMKTMKRHRLLTDVVIKVDEDSFEAHKIILSSASPYFKAMFTAGLQESVKNTVRLEGICPKAMSSLLRFMYSGQITIDKNSVCSILSTAAMLQMRHVLDASCAFLEHHLDPSNVLGIASFVYQHGCVDMYAKCNVFIEQHFAQVCQCEEFLSLSAYQLVELIRRDGLNVPEEKCVYKAVLNWVRKDESVRRKKMSEILTAVRCQHLSPQFLNEQVHHCQILKKVPECQRYLYNIFKDLSLHKPALEQQRIPTAPSVIYIVGGYSNRTSLDTLELYDLQSKQCTQLSTLPSARSGLGAVYLNDLLYAVGGRTINPDGSYQDCNWTNIFDAVNNKWCSKAPLMAARNRLGMGVVDGQLYAVGGSDGCLYHKSVERYDADEDCWEWVKPMMEARMGVGVTVVNRMMFVIGGYNGERRLRSAERYHPEKNRWSMLPSMKLRRSGAGVCSIGNLIYVIGGYDGEEHLSSVEVFNTATNTWSSAPHLSKARSAMTVATWKGNIYVMGGYDGSGFLSSVEELCKGCTEWRAGKSLPLGRSGHACATSCRHCTKHA